MDSTGRRGIRILSQILLFYSFAQSYFEPPRLEKRIHSKAVFFGATMKEPINYLARKSVYDKVNKYLFNSENERGWAKGRWFMLALGFNPEKPEHVKMLARQIYFDSSQATFKVATGYGEQYDQLIAITGPNGKTIDGIKTGWQKDKGSDFFRLLTILPPKKKR
jgi:hypothetical protein